MVIVDAVVAVVFFFAMCCGLVGLWWLLVMFEF